MQDLTEVFRGGIHPAPTRPQELMSYPLGCLNQHSDSRQVYHIWKPCGLQLWLASRNWCHWSASCPRNTWLSTLEVKAYHVLNRYYAASLSNPKVNCTYLDWKVQDLTEVFWGEDILPPLGRSNGCHTSWAAWISTATVVRCTIYENPVAWCFDLPHGTDVIDLPLWIKLLMTSQVHPSISMAVFVVIQLTCVTWATETLPSTWFSIAIQLWSSEIWTLIETYWVHFAMNLSYTRCN